MAGRLDELLLKCHESSSDKDLLLLDCNLTMGIESKGWIVAKKGKIIDCAVYWTAMLKFC